MKNISIQKLYASDGPLVFTESEYVPKKAWKGRNDYIKEYGQIPQGLVEIK
jgi:hypothetical protein